MRDTALKLKVAADQLYNLGVDSIRYNYINDSLKLLAGIFVPIGCPL